MKTFYLLLIALALLILLINKRQLNKRLYLFIPLLVMALLSDGMNSWLGDGHWLSRLFFILYTPVEYTLQSLIICSYLKDAGRKKMVMRSIPIFVLAALLVQLWLKNVDDFYTYMDVLIQAPLVCAWSLLYITELAHDGQDISYRNNPMFIISFAHLLFYSVGIFAYGFGSYFMDEGNLEYTRLVFGIGKVFNLVLYALYITAFATPWMTRQKY
jgi:hypothetical protein